MHGENQIEMTCKKGAVHSENQDNIFIIDDGDVKYLGVFDGHGPFGHRVSSFCQLRFMRMINECP
jgi:serine/threonine protein phosphatase PrpC